MSEPIKPGYLLKITTWENDADNYNTVDYDGLTESETIFLIKIAMLFKSVHDYKDPGIGNSDAGQNLSDIIDKVVASHRALGGTIPKDWDKTDPEHAEYLSGEYADSFYDDDIYDMIGIWCEGEYYRVFDRFEVFYVPGSIENVTSKFK